MRTAAVICSGDELVYGFVEDKNSIWLAGRLLSLGIEPIFHGVIADNAALYGETLHWSLAAADVVITTGGLGPTVDDLTRVVVSRVTGRRLITVKKAEDHIKNLLSRLGVCVTESELRQALIPEGAEPIFNRYGTACGFAVRVGSTWLFCLSGVPQEMKQMFDEGVLPRLKGTGPPLYWRRFNTMGLSESELQTIVHSVDLPKGVRVAYTSYDFLVTLTLYTRKKEELEKASEMLKVAIPSEKLVSEGSKALNEALFEALQEAGATVAVAESFTGGLVIDRITDVPGISAFFKGGVVAYSLDAKKELLGVSDKTLKEKGVYSEEVAVEMARGVAERLGAELGVGTTGVAGPDAESPGSPVGLAFIAVWGRGKKWVKRFMIPGSRRDIKSRAANIALNMLRLTTISTTK